MTTLYSFINKCIYRFFFLQITLIFVGPQRLIIVHESLNGDVYYWKNNYSVKIMTVPALSSEHVFLSFVGDYILSAIIIVRNYTV